MLQGWHSSWCCSACMRGASEASSFLPTPAKRCLRCQTTAQDRSNVRLLILLHACVLILLILRTCFAASGSKPTTRRSLLVCRSGSWQQRPAKHAAQIQAAATAAAAAASATAAYAAPASAAAAAAATTTPAAAAALHASTNGRARLRSPAPCS